MSANDFLSLTRKQPFVPFRIITSDDTVYDVRHPDLLMVGLSSVIVGYPSGEEPRVFTKFDVVSLRHVVRLEPGDIIFVPNSPFTTIKRYANLIVNTFVTTIAANEGIRAGGQNVGVNVAVPVNVTTPPTTGGNR